VCVGDLVYFRHSSRNKLPIGIVLKVNRLGMNKSYSVLWFGNKRAYWYSVKDIRGLFNDNEGW
jgi:hypothetical protein